jgi:hypothetical protein
VCGCLEIPQTKYSVLLQFGKQARKIFANNTTWKFLEKIYNLLNSMQGMTNAAILHAPSEPISAKAPGLELRNIADIREKMKATAQVETTTTGEALNVARAMIKPWKCAKTGSLPFELP